MLNFFDGDRYRVGIAASTLCSLTPTVHNVLLRRTQRSIWHFVAQTKPAKGTSDNLVRLRQASLW